MLSIGVLGRSEAEVLQLSTLICILLSLATVGMFLYLVDYALKALRPVSVVDRVATIGRRVIESVYPDTRDATRDARRSVLEARPGVSWPPLPRSYPPRETATTTRPTASSAMEIAVRHGLAPV